MFKDQNNFERVKSQDPKRDKSVIKIVQTLWTKPNFEDNTSIHQRFHGGWLSKKYNYMSWTLSCLQFRKFYDNVELITDVRGKHLLIDILGLPYTKVKVELDCLNHYPSSLWALPKIYTYKLQDEPFIHADGDVLIWEKFSNLFETAQLCSQQMVIDHKPHYTIMQEIESCFNFIPDCILKDRKENMILKTSNAGLFGGSNLDFFKEYVNMSFQFVEKNLSQLTKIKTATFGIIFEEYLFYCMAKERNIEITYLLNPIDNDFTGNRLVDFETVPTKTKFIHPVGSYKSYQQVCDLLAYTLLLNYPKYYYKILRLLSEFEI
jgi:hypothetical protein